jgi:hypothetical protein
VIETALAPESIDFESCKSSQEAAEVGDRGLDRDAVRGWQGGVEFVDPDVGGAYRLIAKVEEQELVDDSSGGGVPV